MFSGSSIYSGKQRENRTQSSAIKTQRERDICLTIYLMLTLIKKQNKYSAGDSLWRRLSSARALRISRNWPDLQVRQQERGVKKKEIVNADCLGKMHTRHLSLPAELAQAHKGVGKWTKGPANVVNIHVYMLYPLAGIDQPIPNTEDTRPNVTKV